MTAAFVVVLAGEHPVRDAWVDEQARQAPPEHNAVPIGDDTYRGLWRLPPPERTVVHLFAERGDVDRIRGAGFEPITASVGYRCARGADCPSYVPGMHHAHGATGDPRRIALNHRAGCSGNVDRYDGGAGELSCACGAAVAQ